MESYRLTYFNKRGGGEIIRLVLVAAGQKFEDERLNPGQWSARKQEMPLKNLPVLHVKNGKPGTTFCQSGAIARFLARKFGFYGDSATSALVIDEIYDSVSDVRSVFVQIHFSKSEKQKEELQNRLVNDVLPKFNDYFEQRMTQFGENGYAVGSKQPDLETSKMTFEELAPKFRPIYNYTEHLESQNIDKLLEVAAKQT